jgi:hypothetical protein
MNLTVSGDNLDLGEALRQPVLEKVEATVAGAFGGSVNSHVAMTREASSRLWLGRNPKKLESASAAATWMSWSGGRAGENGSDTFDPAVVAENSPIAELALTGAPWRCSSMPAAPGKRCLPAAQSRDRLARSAGLA